MAKITRVAPGTLTAGPKTVPGLTYTERPGLPSPKTISKPKKAKMRSNRRGLGTARLLAVPAALTYGAIAAEEGYEKEGVKGAVKEVGRTARNVAAIDMSFRGVGAAAKKAKDKGAFDQVFSKLGRAAAKYPRLARAGKLLGRATPMGIASSGTAFVLGEAYAAHKENPGWASGLAEAISHKRKTKKAAEKFIRSKTRYGRD
jgi:hypothetical protein